MVVPRQFLLFCLAILGLFAPFSGDGEIEQARAKFADGTEGSCNEGAAICVRLNNVAAVELMLEVMSTMEDRGRGYLPQGHLRDITWGALGKITDPYARKRVETELRNSKSSTWTKQWCAELLGIYGDGDFGDSLLKALIDRDDGVQRAAALSLGKCKYAAAVKPLLVQVNAKDYILRTNAVDALMRIDPLAHKAVLVRSLKDRDGGVRCAILGIAAQTLPNDVEALSTAALTDTDWRPRAQAVENLGAIRTKTSVDALIGSLDDGRPTVAARALEALKKLTGEKHKSRTTWEAWWRDHRESFSFPEGKAGPKESAGATVAYHGIELSSDRVAFMIDVSNAMGETLKSKSVSKREAAQAELEAVLDKLEGRLTFNAFCYAEATAIFEEKGSVELNARSKKKALEFVEQAGRGSQKDIWRALTTVLEDPELDTAFLLSSGEPDTGTYVHWNRVTWHLADLNRFRKVKFHTIAYTDSKWYREQLEKIAEVTGGEFRSFE